MSDLIVVTKAIYVGNYVLKLTFSDGVTADLDFSTWIDRYAFFAPLKETEYFKNFVLDGWTVTWPNGADIAPETLHKIALEQHQHQPV